MLIGILGGRVPDEVGDLDGDLLQHGLDAIIKLGLTKGHSSETELRLSLNKPCPMLSGQNGGNFTATLLRRPAAERAARTPSRTAGSPDISSS